MVFSSELKALATLPDFPMRHSMSALVDYAAHRYVPSPGSIFEDVQKIRPGSHCSILPDGSLTSERYWRYEPGASTRYSDPAETGSRLMAAVERHLMSERPLGVFLSGGLDSSAVVACMHRSGHRDIRTYTVGFEGFIDNEFENARRVAEHFKTNHTEILITPSEFWDVIGSVAYMMDDPLADPNSIPLSRLCARAKQDVVVVLLGEGSDELMAGYNGMERERQFFDTLHRLRRNFRWATRLVGPLLSHSPSLKNKIQAINGTDAEYLMHAIYRYDGLFDKQFRHKYGLPIANRFDPLARMAEYYGERPAWEGVNLLMGGAFEWWLADDLLQRADRIGMAYSLELRCPFLDMEYMQFCTNLPLDQKVRGRGPEPLRKIALKKAFQDILPANIALQRKKGFVLPILEWLTTVYKEQVDALLRRPDTLIARLFPEEVRLDIFRMAAAGDAHSQGRLSSMVFLTRWEDAWSHATLTRKRLAPTS